MQVIHFKGVRLWLLLMLASLLAGCGINNIPNYDEQVKADRKSVV